MLTSLERAAFVADVAESRTGGGGGGGGWTPLRWFHPLLTNSTTPEGGETGPTTIHPNGAAAPQVAASISLPRAVASCVPALPPRLPLAVSQPPATIRHLIRPHALPSTADLRLHAADEAAEMRQRGAVHHSWSEIGPAHAPAPGHSSSSAGESSAIAISAGSHSTAARQSQAERSAITTVKDDPLTALSPEWRSLLARQESIEHVRSDPAVHALVLGGVPACARAPLWKLLSGSNEERRRYSSDYYAKLAAHHRAHGSGYDDEIRRDLTRTLPSLDLFNPRKQPPDDEQHVASSSQSTDDVDQQPVPSSSPPLGPSLTGTGGLAQLNRVLCAYALRNRTVGYCQGMSMLAATLLTVVGAPAGSDLATVMAAEEDAFWLLALLVESAGRCGYYCKSMAGLEVDQLALGSLVSYYLPAVADHLRQFDVPVAAFTVSWFVCLFVEAPLEARQVTADDDPLSEEAGMGAIYAVWDRLLLRGDEFLFAMALALLRSREAEILRRRDTGELLEFLLRSGFRRPIGSGGINSPQSAVSPVTIGQSPVSIRTLLDSEVPRFGNLAPHIASLREHHRADVLARATRLHPQAAQRLAETYKFTNIGSSTNSGAEEVQRLWAAFLSANPWSILLQGSLTSLVHFHASLSPLIFPFEVRRRWRDQGLFSGLLARLFATVDADRTGECSFEAFLACVALFTRGEEEERVRFAFRFFDTDGDGWIGEKEMTLIFDMMHHTYNGRALGDQPAHTPAAASELDELLTGSPTIPGLTRSTSVASTMSSSEDSEAVSALFVSELFNRAADLALKNTSASVSASMHASTHASVLAGLYSTGLSYSHFRRVIALHPLSQLTFGLARSESRSIVRASSNASAHSRSSSRLASTSVTPVSSLPPTPSATEHYRHLLENSDVPEAVIFVGPRTPILPSPPDATLPAASSSSSAPPSSLPSALGPASSNRRGSLAASVASVAGFPVVRRPSILLPLATTAAAASGTR